MTPMPTVVTNAHPHRNAVTATVRLPPGASAVGSKTNSDAAKPRPSDMAAVSARRYQLATQTPEMNAPGGHNRMSKTGVTTEHVVATTIATIGETAARTQRISRSQYADVRALTLAESSSFVMDLWRLQNCYCAESRELCGLTSDISGGP
jgi:hypothetical protein